MNISVEDIFMVIMAFLFGLFLRKEMACGLVEGVDDAPDNGDQNTCNDFIKKHCEGAVVFQNNHEGCVEACGNHISSLNLSGDEETICPGEKDNIGITNFCNGLDPCYELSQENPIQKIEDYKKCDETTLGTVTCPDECEKIRKDFCNTNVTLKYKDRKEIMYTMYELCQNVTDQQTFGNTLTPLEKMCKTECSQFYTDHHAEV